jgi:hypothetical protein
MAKIQSPDELKEYCLRKLGKPVINIEIADEQCLDRIDDAIEYFVERHFDGSTESFYKITIKDKDVKNKYLTLPEDIIVVTDILKESTSNVEVMDNFEYNAMDEIMRSGGFSSSVVDYFLSMSHLSMVLDMFEKSKLFTYNNSTNKLIPQFKVNGFGSGNLLTSATDITNAAWVGNNATLTSNDTLVPNGKLLGDTITSDGAGVFGFSQDVETKHYVRGMYTTKVSLYSGTYTGQVNISLYDSSDVLVKSKSVSMTAGKWEEHTVEGTFGKNHKNGYKLVINSATGAAAAGETFHVASIMIYKNAIMLIKGFSAVDAEDSVDVYNDRWIKKYTTALMKQQWGSNVKKFSGVQMAGGIELNGQTIYDEATAELDKLEEQFSLEYELPLDMIFE